MRLTWIPACLTVYALGCQGGTVTIRGGSTTATTPSLTTSLTLSTTTTTTSSPTDVETGDTGLVDALALLEADDVLGQFLRQPVDNDWHTGEITGAGNGLLWTNVAGVSWELTAELPSGRLDTGPDCPYFDDPGGDAFVLELDQGTDGIDLPEVVAFWFLGERYSRP